MNFYLGIDFGTSGARAIVIDSAGIIQAETQYLFADSTDNLTTIWQQALLSLIAEIPEEIRGGICAIAINGTSSTVLLCDQTGNPIDSPILYNDSRGAKVIDKLKEIAPPNHTVISATSSLAKLLWWQDIIPPLVRGARGDLFFLHQADWLAFLLHGQLGISDYHNALKLGYDVEKLCYPEWIKNLEIPFHLPNVLTPGTAIAEVTSEIAASLKLKKDCLVCAGTTDSIAAFLASGAKLPGEASTSLGSTLVIKLLSNTRVDEAKYGIYSHRLGDLWLVGGASNTGGAVLKSFFSDSELESLSSQINAEKPSNLDYYPLLKPGDRFPINDPNLPPKLEPRPENSVEFLHGLLESIARIEARGYELLKQLGATPLTCVYTAGGGAKNPTWTKIRERYLQVPILNPTHTQAAYGSAILAMQGINKNL
ncbi:FGGY-family carbohydrate kinase [Phormidium sp. LEGE 05292]|uniref:FGGY-family carbohydrate kinase n=1 Tax=[Phormidium] sp. LEGE 05292 TaxID=767427 RepID=UPI0018825194|nr:FGGY-family carbohydrate kinase [Phormidium sp. LEGE 05292]MBE9227296.1 FGGY-family carbohydrate kinase [Phormidium sp. LEGE 05292]